MSPSASWLRGEGGNELVDGSEGGGARGASSSAGWCCWRRSSSDNRLGSGSNRKGEPSESSYTRGEGWSSACVGGESVDERVGRW